MKSELRSAVFFLSLLEYPAGIPAVAAFCFNGCAVFREDSACIVLIADRTGFLRDADRIAVIIIPCRAADALMCPLRDKLVCVIVAEITADMKAAEIIADQLHCSVAIGIKAD